MHRYFQILIALFLISCAKEQALPVEVDFTIDVFNNDFSIPVSVVILNNTDGAESYEWAFQGGMPETSINRSPGVIVYNEKGTYDITLTASNEDGSVDSKTIPIVIDDAVVIDFDVINLVDTFSPAVFNIENKSFGATAFEWTFEGGDPNKSTLENPGNISFTEPGEHIINLEVTNGRETFDVQKSINVAPLLVADFDFEVDFGDQDLQTPVRVTIENKSISATAYNWSFSGASPAISSEENPVIVFTETGNQTLILEATNGKETKTKTLTIPIANDTNLRVIDEVIFGINIAHNNDVLGAFYSLEQRRIFTKTEVEEENASSTIDLVFFGFNSAFNNNSFESPSNLSGTTFQEFSEGKDTIFINSQELCNCNASMTSDQFDAMIDDSLLNTLSIQETTGGTQDFSSSMEPRVVLFQTEEGKKGAIKIIEFVEDGNDSFIRTSIKFQKESR